MQRSSGPCVRAAWRPEISAVFYGEPASRGAGWRFRRYHGRRRSGDYFASFYQGLLGGSSEYVASVLREDGTLLARYPETGAMSAPGSKTN